VGREGATRVRLSKPLADGGNHVSGLERAEQSRVSLPPLPSTTSLTRSGNSGAHLRRFQGATGHGTIHLALCPAAAPICADDFGAASYVSPPP